MKKFFILLAVLISIILLAFRLLIYPSLPILNGFAAKALCSCVFVAGIPEEVAKKDEAGFFPVSLASTQIDYDKKMVTAKLFGMVEKKAYHRKGQGCAIFNELPPPQSQVSSSTGLSKDTLLADYSSLSSSQKQNLDKALEWAFTEEDVSTPKKRTRGVAVMYQGKLIGERYAEGFGPDSRMLGWSMTKSITSLLYGILENDNSFIRDKSVISSKWKQKQEISYTDLLQMSSGMEWDENYATMSAVTKMLYAADTFGAAVATYPIIADPGSEWYYSSGTSNLLTYLLSDFFTSSESYLNFPKEALF